jgi:hypothetical protein
LDIFSIDTIEKLNFNKDLVQSIENGIDKQIFNQNHIYGNAIKRFKIKGFDIKVIIDEPYPIEITGKVFVEFSVFFDKTISLSYRLLFDEEACLSSSLLTTDHLIQLISLKMGAEFWHADEDENLDTSIDLELKNIIISNCPIDDNGNYTIETKTIDQKYISPFKEVSNRYISYLTNKKATEKIEISKFVFVDIWENLSHYEDLFSKISEAEIISHIHENHKPELIGLMTMYPSEWPYRDSSAFEEVCGANIAIDTDDLVLVNTNMCLVIGTYGLRGGDDALTDWAEHLKERRTYHVSWPEYLMLLEMLLAKKHTMNVAKEKLLESIISIHNKSGTTNAIEENAISGLEITKLLVQLNAVSYSKFISHKVMFDRTMIRLEIQKEAEEFSSLRDMINESLRNISDMRELKESQKINLILSVLSIISMIDIVFQSTELPFLEKFGINSQPLAMRILEIITFLIFSALFYFLFNVAKKSLLKIINK